MEAEIRRRKIFLNLGRRVQRRVFVLRRLVRALWDRILACSLGKPARYRMLQLAAAPSPTLGAVDSGFSSATATPVIRPHHEMDSDLVSLKISLLGDCQIGKTSFLMKYIGNEKEESMQGGGINSIDKTMFVKGARISYSIWEVEGDESSQKNIPMACTDSVAILFMFDLTSRCTLNSVISWYQKSRRWNQTAIPILIGTKFDEFIQLPIDLQWTIASQARAYARALNATLFFSSADYNINVNKIFKFITAKFFDLPWTVERNLNIGEPIIDF